MVYFSQWTDGCWNKRCFPLALLPSAYYQQSRLKNKALDYYLTGASFIKPREQDMMHSWQQVDWMTDCYNLDGLFLRRQFIPTNRTQWLSFLMKMFKSLQAGKPQECSSTRCTPHSSLTSWPTAISWTRSPRWLSSAQNWWLPWCVCSFQPGFRPEWWRRNGESIPAPACCSGRSYPWPPWCSASLAGTESRGFLCGTTGWKGQCIWNKSKGKRWKLGFVIVYTNSVSYCTLFFVL